MCDEHSTDITTTTTTRRVQGVQHKSLVELAQELTHLQAQAAANKLPPEALTGGTVTISNIGVRRPSMCALSTVSCARFWSHHTPPTRWLPLTPLGTVGGTYATPRVTPPESAIVALGKLQQLPRYDSHGVLVRSAIMRASWGADHRVVDGATLAQCSNVWKGLLECPDRLLLSLR